MISKKQLITGCQKGDKKCQYHLVDKYSGMLLTCCRRYARDDAMAKDLLQETFIRIFTALPKYKPTGSFEGWMRKIAVNCSLQWINKSYFKKESHPVEMQEETQQPEILDALATEEIIKQIQTLPDGYRTVLNLYIVEGFSHKEIAETLGISVVTSRSQLLRGRNSLIKKLNDLQKKLSA